MDHALGSVRNRGRTPPATEVACGCRTRCSRRSARSRRVSRGLRARASRSKCCVQALAHDRRRFVQRDGATDVEESDAATGRIARGAIAAGRHLAATSLGLGGRQSALEPVDDREPCPASGRFRHAIASSPMIMRSFSRQRARIGPTLPTGRPSRAAISSVGRFARVEVQRGQQLAARRARAARAPRAPRRPARTPDRVDRRARRRRPLPCGTSASRLMRTRHDCRRATVISQYGKLSSSRSRPIESSSATNVVCVTSAASSRPSPLRIAIVKIRRS